MKRIVQVVLIALGVVMGSATWAQEDLHRVNGFRSAQFGMSEQEVFNAIQRDFGFGEEQIEFLHNERDSTFVMHIIVPEMEPGPGPAHVYYILGATSQTLMHVNVLWLTSTNPSDEERDQIGIAGMQLARYFMERSWRPENVQTGAMRADGEVVTFAGIDPTGAGVEVLVKGVPVSDASGQTLNPQGEAMLRVGYTQRYGRPDTISVQSGDF